LHIDGSQDGYATWKNHTESIAETLLLVRGAIYRLNENHNKAMQDLENQQQMEIAKLQSIQDQADNKLGYLMRTIQDLNTALREVNQQADNALNIRSVGGNVPFRKGNHGIYSHPENHIVHGRQGTIPKMASNINECHGPSESRVW
jgi:hypothetical protein